MSSRTLLILLVALASRLLSAERPNILFIAVDDLRDTLGCYGYPGAITPHIDRLASRGVRFERAYVQYPVCNPSRSSFLTGLRPDQTRVFDNKTALREARPNVLTWPEYLKQRGWRTVANGKIFHLGGGASAKARNRFVDLGRSWDEARSFDATAAGKQMLDGRNLTGGALSWCRWGMANGRDDDQPDGQTARAVAEEIGRAGVQPWVIGAGFLKPHDPFIAPTKYFDLYPIDKLVLHRDPPDQTPAPPLAVGFGPTGKAFDKFTDKERTEFLRAYLAATSFMDAQVGRVLAELDKRGLWERTVVILVGDHGYHLGERNWWNKNTLFERSCRAPLIIAAPGVKPGVARGIVEFVDLFPTIVDFSGLEMPTHLVGRSLRPLLLDPELPGRHGAYTVVTRGPGERGDSVRTDRWRYTEWSDGTRELYDHEMDPGETRNVLEQHPDTAAELRSRLAAKRAVTVPDDAPDQ